MKLSVYWKILTDSGEYFQRNYSYADFSDIPEFVEQDGHIHIFSEPVKNVTVVFENYDKKPLKIDRNGDIDMIPHTGSIEYSMEVNDWELEYFVRTFVTISQNGGGSRKLEWHVNGEVITIGN